jgi:hypothetical protein
MEGVGYAEGAADGEDSCALRLVAAAASNEITRKKATTEDFMAARVVGSPTKKSAL